MRIAGVTFSYPRPALFSREYGEDSFNIITPNVYGYAVRPGIAAELSSGDGIEPGTTIWGVSVARRLPDGTTARDKGRAFSTKAEAVGYVAELLAEAEDGIRQTS